MLRASDADRLLGLFGEVDLRAPIGYGEIGDRPEGEPTLAEMTEAALARLPKGEDGFFVVLEEEGTDSWGHANDAPTVMNSAKPYEDAVRIARDYAEAHPGTLIVSVADHETGGMTLEFDVDRTPAAFRPFEAAYVETLTEAHARVTALGEDADAGAVAESVNAVVGN